MMRRHNSGTGQPNRKLGRRVVSGPTVPFSMWGLWEKYVRARLERAWRRRGRDAAVTVS
jgi:hypothetical protein